MERKKQKTNSNIKETLGVVFDYLTCQQLRDMEIAISGIFQARKTFDEIHATLARQCRWAHYDDIGSVCSGLKEVCDDTYINFFKETTK